MSCTFPSDNIPDNTETGEVSNHGADSDAGIAVDVKFSSVGGSSNISQISLVSKDATGQLVVKKSQIFVDCSLALAHDISWSFEMGFSSFLVMIKSTPVWRRVGVLFHLANDLTGLSEHKPRV